MSEAPIVRRVPPVKVNIEPVAEQPVADAPKQQELVTPQVHPAPQAEVPSVNLNQQAIITVSRSKYSDESEDKEYQERVDVPVLHTSPAYVKVEGGLTKNMGNYNSLKVSVSVSMPAYPVTSELNRAYEFASDFVNKKIHEETEYALGRHQDLVELPEDAK